MNAVSLALNLILQGSTLTMMIIYFCCYEVVYNEESGQGASLYTLG